MSEKKEKKKKKGKRNKIQTKQLLLQWTPVSANTQGTEKLIRTK